MSTSSEGRLLVVGHAANHTGPPIYLLNLLRWLREHEPDVEVDVALLSGGDRLAEMRELASVTVVDPPSLALSRAERRLVRQDLTHEADLRARRRADALRDLMAPFRDHGVVYVNCAPSIELVQAMPPAPRVVLSHIHELEMGLVHKLPASSRDAVLHQATRIFSVSHAVTDHLVHHHGIDPSSIEQQPEMVDVRAIQSVAGTVDRARARRDRGLDPDALVVGGSGTIEHRKGTDLFLQMAWHLVHAQPSRPVTFVWVGGDPATIARGQALAEALGVDDAVRFVGPQTDPAAWFELMDVFVMPSREDPYPLVCIEAAAVGTPVVAFDTGGIPELLRQGCGEVVAYPDVAALAASVRGLLEDGDRRAALGARGRELALADHDVTVVAPRVWAAIDRWR